MYTFQSCLNLVVISNLGQATLIVPVMAPLTDLVGVSKRIAVPAYQTGAGSMDALAPVSASLIRVLRVASIDWSKRAKLRIRM